MDGTASPIPLTRVEKVDDEASYGEEPGTEAYRLREQDAAPDEIAIVPDHKSPSISIPDSKPTSPSSPSGPIPLMIVEKIDPESPSHGEVPGTLAHEMRAADAVPDLVIRSGTSERSRSSSVRSRANSTPGDLPIPITKVEKIDSTPRHGEVPGTKAYELRRGDAEPDIVEEVGKDDVPGKGISLACPSERLTGSGSPTSPAARSPIINHARRKSSAAGKKGLPAAAGYDEVEDGSEGGFGDDFDDFEEGEEDAEFGDFDDGFQEAAPAPPPPQSIQVPPSIVSSKLYSFYTPAVPTCQQVSDRLADPQSASSGFRRSRFPRGSASRNRVLRERPLPTRLHRHLRPPTRHSRTSHLPHATKRISLVPARRTSPPAAPQLDPVSHPATLPRLPRRARRPRRDPPGLEAEEAHPPLHEAQPGARLPAQLHRHPLRLAHQAERRQRLHDVRGFAGQALSIGLQAETRSPASAAAGSDLGAAAVQLHGRGLGRPHGGGAEGARPQAGGYAGHGEGDVGVLDQEDRREAR